MRKGEMSAPARIGLLLEWLNDPVDVYSAEPTALHKWETRGRRVIGKFLASFDGSAASGHVEVLRWPKDVPRFIRRTSVQKPLDLDALQDLQLDVRTLLEGAFDGQPMQAGSLEVPTLRFGARRVREKGMKLSTLTQRERRAYQAAGAYVLQVTGSTRDLTVYLVLHLLTTAGIAGMLARCPAPIPHNWKRRCNRWLLRTGHGQKRRYCATRCRVRSNAENKARQVSEGRRRK